MNKLEKEQFIEQLLDNIKCKLTRLTGNFPEEWDGIELRWLIVDTVNENTVFGSASNKKTKRYRDYKNERIVRNL